MFSHDTGAYTQGAFFTSNVSPLTSMESWSSALHSKAERISFGTVIRGFAERRDGLSLG